MKNGQFPAIFNLSDLNGQNGFKIDGENNNDFSSYSLSAAGDVNGDGYADLVIGAPYYPSGNPYGGTSCNCKGRSYVVFGGPGVGSSGTIALSNLTGANGFKLDGENNNDESGISVSTAGDINGDGHADLLIGAPCYLSGYPSNCKGRSYVVFGGPEVGSHGMIALSNLTGVNGFKLDGENDNDKSGYSVSAAGDINGDGIADLLIGAFGYPNKNAKGRSYVVFGGPGVGGSNGTIALSNLTGANGFKLDGENNGDDSGWSVSTAGDVNGDGYADLLIGAVTYPNFNAKGRSYVVFGGPGSSVDILLSSLNGTNGFKLEGENNGDNSGYSVSGAGDVNGDGYTDLLIGAPGYPSGKYKGRSYVVFGGPEVGSDGMIALSDLTGVNGFKLDGENNQEWSACSVSGAGDINGDGYGDLTIGASMASGTKGRSYVVFGGLEINGNGVIALSNLIGANGFKLDGERAYDQIGHSVSTAGDINGDGVDDLLIGAVAPVNFTGRSYVVFGDAPPVLVNNTLNVYTGAVLRLTSANLAAYDRNHDNHTLLFIPSEVTHGRFEYVNSSGTGVSNFTQQAIIEQTIQFVHDGGSEGPTYNITIRSSGIAWTGPIPANISFNLVVLINNQLTINQGQTVILTDKNLQATDAGQVDSSLDFLISNLQYGRFELTTEPEQAVFTFKQQDISNQNVLFIHDNSIVAPSYQVAVSNGKVITLPQSVQVDFDTIPILISNRMVINQGQSLLITQEILNATHPLRENDSELRFDISIVQHGQFSWMNSPLDPLTSFYQRNITDHLIQFNHDNSIIAPSYNVTVTDGRTSSLSQAAQIDFDTIPILLNNSMRIDQSEIIILNSTILSATHPTGKDSILLFNITDIGHGQFNLVSFPGESINQFYQQNITDSQVQFVQDNSVNAPAYSVSVTDGRTHSLPQAAQIDFDTIPVLINNQLRVNQGETVTILSDGLSATHPGHDDDSYLQFILINVAHGLFHWQNFPDEALTQCYQQNITDGLIQFTHDNSTQAPAYQVSVTDGRTISSVRAATIDFDASPILLNNSLIINQGDTIRITSSALSAIHPGGDDSLLQFNISAIEQGQFSWITAPNNPIFNFYQQNITDGIIQFTHDNSTQAPSYWVSVSDGRITLSPVAAKIDFDLFPILENNQLVINQGQTLKLTSSNLRATHAGSEDGNLSFIISDCQYGQFEWIKSPDTAITVFQQQNITDQLVQFVHDNSISAPTYRVAVSDGRITTTPSWSSIDFDLNPILINNQLTIGEGATVILTPKNLLATHQGVADPGLIFMISNIQSGGFLISSVDETLTGDVSFIQQQITTQQVRFYQQGSGKPGYQVSVTDGRITLPPASANVTFYAKPVLTQNQFLVSSGQSVWLTSDNLAATRAGEMAEDLQFLVSSVNHGRFEKRNNSGVEILLFSQQDVLQQNIQFVADKSGQLPDCRLKVWDSSTDLASDVQQTGVILVVSNYFKINQGDKFNLTENVLNATTNRGNNGDIVFTPITGAVQHGQFELVSNPHYPLTRFQQKQINAHEVVFISDNATSAPSAYLTISDGQSGSVKGTMACQMDFDAAPLLQSAYLSTQTGRREQITDINLKATSMTASVKDLVFEISDISNGYFADKNEWQTELRQFTQQNVTDNNIIFVTDKTGLAPQFKVSVGDGRMQCWACPQPADVVFDTSTPSNSSLSDVIKNAIIGAVASGVVGLLFFALKYKHSLGLQRNARPTIDGEEQETYSDTLLLPIAREIFSRIKITGCLGYIGKRDYNEYVGAVSVIVAALETKDVIQPNSWNSLSRPKKQRIIDAIATHTKELVGNNRCCSMRTFTSFYRAEATPRMLRNQAEAIANAVQETLSNRTEAKGTGSRSSMRLTQTSNTLNSDSQFTTPLLS